MYYFYRGLIVTAIIVIALITFKSAPVDAADYNDPLMYTPGTTDTPNGPHGGYTTTTNKCKECHAVHLATGSSFLTRANSSDQACDFCHGIGGVASKKVTLNDEGHGLSDTQKSTDIVVAPDDTVEPFTILTSYWGCSSCHTPHDNEAVILKGSNFTTSKLLRADPNPGKTYSYYNPELISAASHETTQTLSQWCSTCHNANFGSRTDPKLVRLGATTRYVFGHDSSGEGYTTDALGRVIVNPDDGINNGPACKQCHMATGIGGNFPHSAESTPTAGSLTAPDMLKEGTKPNQLDNVCMDCHNTTSLP